MLLTYHLFFDGPVHFGLEGIGQERIETTVRSDTLWGAIIQKWLLLFKDEPDALCQDPLFSVSSCFPLIKGIPFYPVPIGVMDSLVDEVGKQETKCDDDISVKDLKKINYLSEDLFGAVLRGESLSIEQCRDGMTFPVISFGKHQTKPQKKRDAFAEEIQRPRIKTDQLVAGVGENSFFYCTDQYFDRQSGLFFLASFSNDGIKTQFEAALRLLGDCGLGADQSIGRGSFVFKTQKSVLPQIDAPDKYILLSLYHPTQEEVQTKILSDKKTAYSLVRRSGRAAASGVSRFRRADVWMLAEGSVLPLKPVGDVSVVLQKSDYIPHNVYRYGRAFSWPMASGE
jgi:CRISPR-associated protein Csm4